MSINNAIGNDQLAVDVIVKRTLEAIEKQNTLKEDGVSCPQCGRGKKLPTQIVCDFCTNFGQF